MKEPDSHELMFIWGVVTGIIIGSIVMIAFMSSQIALCI